MTRSFVRPHGLWAERSLGEEDSDGIMSILVEIEDGALRLEKYSSFVSDPAARAISTFTGVTRSNFERRMCLGWSTKSISRWI